MSAHGGPATWWTTNTDSGRYYVRTKAIVQTNIVLNLDAGVSASYTGTGTAWNDLSGVTAAGTLYNSPSWTLPTAFTFNGTTQYVVIPINLSYTQGTIAMWVYPTAANNNNFFVYTANAPATSYSHQLGISTTNKLTAYMYDSGAATPRLSTGSTTLNLNKWYNVALVWLNGSYVRSYINGEQETTSALTTAWTAGSNFYIASNTGGGSGAPLNYLAGRVATTTVYNTALTRDQLKQNYNSLKPRFDQ